MYNFFLSYQNQGTSNYSEFLERMEVRNQKFQMLTPASLPLAGDGLVCSQLTLLWYWLSPLFCEWAQQCLTLG